MGGRGSGRKPTFSMVSSVEDFAKLDADVLRRQHTFVEGCRGTLDISIGNRRLPQFKYVASRTVLALVHDAMARDGSVEPVSQAMRVVIKPCQFGGERAFLRCHAVKNRVECGRLAVRLLWSGRYFVCRKCLGIRYGSQNEDKLERSFRKAKKVSAKLGASNWRDWYMSPKPKGMHWATYERFMSQAGAAADDANAQIIAVGQAYMIRDGFAPIVPRGVGRGT